jgi:hypothetical protein
MFSSILQADLASFDPVQAAFWLIGTALVYFFIRYSLGVTSETDINPVDLFLALLSGGPYDDLSSSDFSY